MIVLSLALATSKNLREYIRSSIFQQNKRAVLSVLNYETQSNKYKIVKVKKSQTLFVEIYDKHTKKQASFSLGKNLLNGAIFLNGRATELASYDLDSDGQKEVIVPTLSKNNKNLIFILKFHLKTNTFSLESPISYIDQMGR